jgi:hypothetical protein
VSPSDQPLQIHIRLSREEAIKFLESLADDETLRERFRSNPYDVLSENGFDITPREGVPESLDHVPSAEEIRSAVAAIGPPPQEGGWNVQRQWAYFPFIGVLGKPMSGGQSD